MHAPCGPVDVEAVASPRAGRVLEVAEHVEALVADGERERELHRGSPRDGTASGGSEPRVVDGREPGGHLLDAAPRARTSSPTRPAHETVLTRRPSHPGHASSAPASTNPTVTATCQTRCWTASSSVSQAAKKLGTTNTLRRSRGKYAFRVNAAPTRLTIRYAVGTLDSCSGRALRVVRYGSGGSVRSARRRRQRRTSRIEPLSWAGVIIDVDSHWERTGFAPGEFPLSPWRDRFPPNDFARLANAVAGDLVGALAEADRPSPAELLPGLVAREEREGGPAILHPLHDSSSAERVAWMDGVGIDHCFVNPGGYWQLLEFLGDDRAAGARRCNDYLTEQLSPTTPTASMRSRPSTSRTRRSPSPSSSTPEPAVRARSSCTR